MPVFVPSVFSLPKAVRIPATKVNANGPLINLVGHICVERNLVKRTLSSKLGMMERCAAVKPSLLQVRCVSYTLH